MGKSLAGLRTHHPCIWYLGTANSSSCRNVRNSRCRQDSDPATPPPKQVIDPHRGAALPVPGGKGATLSLKMEGRQRNPNKQDLLRFPQVVPLRSHPFVPSHFPATVHSPSHLASKCSRLTTSSRLHFLMEAPRPHQTYILEKSVCFSLVNLPC